MGGLLVIPVEDQLTQIMQTEQNTWKSKNILAVLFALLVQARKNDYSKPDSVGLLPTLCSEEPAGLVLYLHSLHLEIS